MLRTDVGDDGSFKLVAIVPVLSRAKSIIPFNKDGFLVDGCDFVGEFGADESDESDLVKSALTLSRKVGDVRPASRSFLLSSLSLEPVASNDLEKLGSWAAILDLMELTLSEGVSESYCKLSTSPSVSPPDIVVFTCLQARYKIIEIKTYDFKCKFLKSSKSRMKHLLRKVEV